jgi:hypothetical protein
MGGRGIGGAIMGGGGMHGWKALCIVYTLL